MMTTAAELSLLFFWSFLAATVVPAWIRARAGRAQSLG